MPICPNGHEVDANTAFCRQCGASMTPLTQAPPPTAVHRRASPSNTAVYVLAGVIVLVGLVAIGIALVLDSGGGGTTGQSSPTSQPTTAAPSSPGVSQGPSASATATALPAGGTLCPGANAAGGTYGTIGSETSCGFVQAVDASYVHAGGATVPSGQTRRVSAISPATGIRYTNIVCTSGDPWVTCVGGKNNTAHLFFSHP